MTNSQRRKTDRQRGHVTVWKWGDRKQTAGAVYQPSSQSTKNARLVSHRPSSQTNQAVLLPAQIATKQLKFNKPAKFCKAVNVPLRDGLATAGRLLEGLVDEDRPPGGLLGGLVAEGRTPGGQFGGLVASERPTTASDDKPADGEGSPKPGRMAGVMTGTDLKGDGTAVEDKCMGFEEDTPGD